MLRGMRPSELGLWSALYQIDPWDEERADLRAAQVALAVSRGMLKKNTGEDFTLDDFMPYREKQEKKVSAYARMRGWLGHLVKKKESHNGG